MHANSAYLEAALGAGATGYVLKSAADEELLTGVFLFKNANRARTSRHPYTWRSTQSAVPEDFEEMVPRQDLNPIDFART